jgi:hypothetical protein
LPKYADKIDANEMKAFQKFILDAKNAGKIGDNSELFIRNGLRNFEAIKNSKFSVASIDALKLNTSKWDRVAEYTKSATKNMKTSLQNLLKDSKYNPFKK